MLFDPGNFFIRLCVVLSYPEATPKGGFDGRMTRRQYSLPYSPREIETAPGVDRDVTRDRKRVCAHDLRPRHSPRGTPHGPSPLGTALGSWEHTPEARDAGVGKRE